MSKTTKSSPHLGSSLDSFLEAEGVSGKFEARAARKIAWQLLNAMQEKSISKARTAVMRGISRTQLNRLLDPDQHVTLPTLNRAATMVGRTLRLELS